MSNNKPSNISLNSYEDIFSTQEQRDIDQREKIQEIELTELHPFKNHPFHVEENDELREMARSITDHGVVTPAIVRSRPEGGYELISGHRRKAASELAGRITMPAVIRELDDDAAIIIMVDSNQQRENLLPSEKAFSYKMKLEAMKHQGKAASRQVGEKLTSVAQLSDSTEDSERQIQRFIRLTNLIPDLLKMLDEKRIAMSPAVELSYLPKKHQETLLDLCRIQQSSPSLSQAVRLKALQQNGKLTEAELIKIMAEQKANQKDKLTFRADKFAAYFPKGFTADQMEKFIINMLEERKRMLLKSRDDAR